jgi:hypothetical protein
MFKIIKTTLLTAVILFSIFIVQNVFAQNMPFSGSLNCTINGTAWSGKVSTAVYDPKDDFLSVVFDATDNSQLQITFKPLAAKFSESLPQLDSFSINHSSLSNRGTWFFIQYVKDKNNLNRRYEMSNAIVKVNKSDITANTIQVEFSGECFTGEFDQTNTFRETESIRIENASTDDVKYMIIQ